MLNLRVARVTAGLTQANLARKAGVSQRHISNIECGRRRGSLDAWQKILRALNLPASALFDAQEPAAEKEAASQ